MFCAQNNHPNISSGITNNLGATFFAEQD